tara:strand:- start:706 stop:921 length:216 start_codon:yes stop_codon:yes gene_type:complete
VISFNFLYKKYLVYKTPTIYKVIKTITRILKKPIKFIESLLLIINKIKNEINIEAINDININKSLLLILGI